MHNELFLLNIKQAWMKFGKLDTPLYVAYVNQDCSIFSNVQDFLQPTEVVIFQNLSKFEDDKEKYIYSLCVLHNGVYTDIDILKSNFYTDKNEYYLFSQNKSIIESEYNNIVLDWYRKRTKEIVDHLEAEKVSLLDVLGKRLNLIKNIS